MKIAATAAKITVIDQEASDQAGTHQRQHQSAD
jgi:hypothetical protein